MKKILKYWAIIGLCGTCLVLVGTAFFEEALTVSPSTITLAFILITLAAYALHYIIEKKQPSRTEKVWLHTTMRIFLGSVMALVISLMAIANAGPIELRGVLIYCVLGLFYARRVN